MSDRISADEARRLREDVARIIEKHTPRTAALDQGPDDVCAAHSFGCSPAWPCIERRLADEVERLEAHLAELREELDEAKHQIATCDQAALRVENERLEADNQRLREVVRTALEMFARHDRWCGHYSEAPGDSIINEFADLAAAALSDEGDTSG